jgi:dipeptidyl aminopeptidase/acylaminoacyl peptidase
MKPLHLILAAQAALAVTPAAAKVPPTLVQSLDMQGFSAPKISPDGRRVVYEETRTNWAANAFETDLWLADVATGERHLLTTAAKSSNNAAWSPDGRQIAFLSDRPGALPRSPADKLQLWVMPAGGGEAQQFTRFDGGVSGFRWAPDSHRLVVTAAEQPDGLKDRKETFGEYHVIHADYAMSHLWLIDLPQADAA